MRLFIKMLEKYLSEEEMKTVRDAGFDGNGLRFPIQELIQVTPKGKSMEDMSRYVDAITYAKVVANDVGFFSPFMKPLETPEVRVSATGLGNLAYIALHIKDETTRETARLLYQQIVSNIP